MKNLGAKATRYIAKSWERSLPNEAYSKFLSNHKKLIKVSYISGTNLSKTFLLRISCSTLRTFPHYQWNLTIKDTKCFSFVNVVEAVVQSLLRKRCSENIRNIKYAEIRFDMGVLLWICCIFSEHLFLRTPLDSYFWQLILNLISTYFRIIFSLFTCWKQKHFWCIGVFRKYKKVPFARSGLIGFLLASNY